MVSRNLEKLYSRLCTIHSKENKGSLLYGVENTDMSVCVAPEEHRVRMVICYYNEVSPLILVNYYDDMQNKTKLVLLKIK